MVINQSDEPLFVGPMLSVSSCTHCGLVQFHTFLQHHGWVIHSTFSHKMCDKPKTNALFNDWAGVKRQWCVTRTLLARDVLFRARISIDGVFIGRTITIRFVRRAAMPAFPITTSQCSYSYPPLLQEMACTPLLPSASSFKDRSSMMGRSDPAIARPWSSSAVSPPLNDQITTS